MCLSVTSVSAQRRASTTLHFITASVAGGAGLGTSGQGVVKPAVGGEGQLAVSYEVLKSGFFFSIGLGADYRLSRYSLTEGMVDQFARVDRDGRPINYRYVYSGYSEQEHTVSATAPVWLGYRIKDKVYFSVGAKLAMPLWNTYSVRTNLYTEGEYPNLIDFVSRNVPSYGFYPSTEFKGKGSYVAPTLSVSPMAEVGAFFRIVPGISCRIGAYVEYAIPVLGKTPTVAQIDYSAVDINPATQSLDNLHSTLRFNSVLNSRLNASAAQYISFGIRATFRFNVTRSPSVCLCERDN